MSKKNSNNSTPPLAIRAIQAVFNTFGPVFPNATGKFAYKIWFTTRKFNKPRFEKNIAEKAKRSTIEVAGTPIRVWTWGESGPTILFIHGWSGRGTQVASFVEPLVNSGFKVVSFDAPAHGETPGSRTDLFKIADALTAVINENTPIHGVITHSFGAVVLSQVIDNIDINRVVLICAPIQLNAMIRNFQRMLHIPDKTADEFLKLLKKDYGNDIVEKINLINNIEKFRVKTMVIHGEKDIDLPWQESEQLSKELPDANFYKAKNLDHIKILYDKTVVNTVKDFLY